MHVITLYFGEVVYCNLLHLLGLLNVKENIAVKFPLAGDARGYGNHFMEKCLYFTISVYDVTV